MAANGEITRNGQVHQLPPVEAGMEHINRYWDPVHQVFAAKILPGEYYVTRFGETIVTVLGSCVSACIRDPGIGVGGMNHFMLPEAGVDYTPGDMASGGSDSTRYGTYAMEQLINDVLKCGGRRTHLEIKLVGGGRVLRHSSDIGAKNIAFARAFLEAEGFRVAGEEVGDIYPRKVYYFPDTGRVRVRKLRQVHNDTVIQRETAYQQQLQQTPVSGEVELF